jgi:hypothetical protein
MKLFATILSVYFLVLTAIPCMDEPEDRSVQKSEISPKTSESHHNDIDHCSPFCTCNCCATPVVNHDTIMEFICVKFSEFNFPNYCSRFSNAYFVSIWQPPQLS